MKEISHAERDVLSAVLTTRGDRILVLDAWRGIACILVLFYHSGANLAFGPIAIQGYVGVHIFFVLSGFLLYSPFTKAIWGNRKTPSVKEYFLRRFLRIYPPYLLCLVLFVAMRAVSKTNSGLPTIANLIAHLGLYFNYGPETWFLSINGVFWTLAIEAQFYVLLPISVWLGSTLLKDRKHAVWAIPIAFIAAGLVSRFVEFSWLTTDANEIRFRTVFSYLDLFGCGMMLASLALVDISKNRVNWLLFPKTSFLVGFFSILLSVSWSHGLGGWQSSTSLFCTLINPLLCACGAALMVNSSLNFGPVTSKLKSLSFNFLRWVGMISYSVYLYHSGVQFFVFKLNLKPPGGWTVMAFSYALISLPPTLLVAWIMYTAVEKPFIKIIAKRRSKIRFLDTYQTVTSSINR